MMPLPWKRQWWNIPAVLRSGWIMNRESGIVFEQVVSPQSLTSGLLIPVVQAWNGDGIFDWSAYTKTFHKSGDRSSKEHCYKIATSENGRFFTSTQRGQRALYGQILLAWGGVHDIKTTFFSFCRKGRLYFNAWILINTWHSLSQTVCEFWEFRISKKLKSPCQCNVRKFLSDPKVCPQGREDITDSGIK